MSSLGAALAIACGFDPKTIRSIAVYCGPEHPATVTVERLITADDGISLTSIMQQFSAHLNLVEQTPEVKKYEPNRPA